MANFLWRYYNLNRVVENDWQIAYIARMDLGQGNVWKGFGEYRFNLRPVGLKVKQLHIRLRFTTYRDGKVKVWICSRDDYTTILDPQELRPVVRARGWDDFIIRVELSGKERGGGYNNAYQDAQLFRQPLYQDAINADWQQPFRVIVELK